MVGVDQRLDQRAVFDTRISTAWRWWRCGYTRMCARWLAEYVIFRLTDDQPDIIDFLTKEVSDIRLRIHVCPQIDSVV